MNNHKTSYLCYGVNDIWHEAVDADLPADSNETP